MDPAPPLLPSPVAPPRLPGFLTSWPACVQLALAFLLGVAATLLAVKAFGFWRWGGRSSEVEHKQIVLHRINLNSAERSELQQLPGVSAKLAQHIEDHRSRTGGFRSVEELKKVPGIGPTTLEQLRPWVYVDTAAEAEPETTLPGKTTAPAPAAGSVPRKGVDPNDPININLASVEELQRLPGIGPKLSQRIVEERQKRPFKSAEDLDRVPGIGPKTVERLRPLVTTENRLVPVTRADY